MTNETPEHVATAMFRKSGRVSFAAGPQIRARGNFSIGEICSISRPGHQNLMAEVVGFSGEETILAPYGVLDGVSHRSGITSHQPEFSIGVGEGLIGRVIDAVGNPIDGKPLTGITEQYPAMRAPPNPMTRPVITEPLPLGIRAIDSCLTCGVGQRMGIFASAGGGKSTLMSMLVKFAACDVCVIALIGERGREVREFVEHSLGAEGMAKSALVIATSDRPAIEQVKAAYTATTIAEYFRDQGKNVLLLMDSLTRFARAQRQIGLSSGEPPTRRGFPPSVFEKLPGLLERGGRTESGSITALYTVLVEGDDMNEPVADETRSLLDGHIILSRDLAASGHYPAIDVAASASRIFNAITDRSQQDAMLKLRRVLAKYKENELLIRMGEYAHGSDPEADEAISRKSAVDAFLRQRTDEHSTYTNTLADLFQAVGHA
ncbi:type III secretion system ATPase, FliI/YscN [Epibacterium ulvae]|uniref:Type III secretion system ATPase, FliI/YscN n=2 Tax=Alphaproteobacteria TaxID=28211 RepID=A0A1G5QJP8_9RHOB|nr:FliI/YscN family ATPase [Epibacterium ulvae]SCZ61828.1 type III secretion system ATPase, FliI/YscN [Epibacterium ulvae]